MTVRLLQRPARSRGRRAAWAAVASAALAAAGGCASIEGTIAQRTLAAPDAVCAFEAGAARADLTPTPGYPLGGFSVAGRMARGVWTPLEARAIYLRDASCTPLVLVSTDLMIMPSGLADRVVDLLHDGVPPEAPSIGRENLILAATENHTSPGNFFSSPLYNSWSTPVGGFDRDLFDFLARRIATAIAAAETQRQPARLHRNRPDGAPATGAGGAPIATDPVLPAFARNRALPAFLRNRGARAFLRAARDVQKLAPCAPSAYADHPLASREHVDPDACLAVWPRVELLDVRAADGSRIALAAFVATHTSVLPPEAEVFAGDLLGTTALRMERGELPATCAADEGAFPVVALFNGAQGDVSAQWRTRDRGELLTLSDRLIGKLCDLLPGAPDPAPRIAFRYEEVDGLADRAFADPFDGARRVHRTPPEADGGIAELGGAADGRTFFHELAHREEIRSYRRTQHGSKQTPFTLDAGKSRISIGRWIFRMQPPPGKAPIGAYRIGSTVLLTVPGEMTTMMGTRTRALVSARVPDARVLIVGFGNGHVSYFPTPEEYDAQWYEGASDYYGPGTGSMLAARLADLAAGLDGASTLLPGRPYGYAAGGSIHFAARDVGYPSYDVDDGLEAIVQQLDPAEHHDAGKAALQMQPRVPERDFPTFCWIDALPRLEGLADAPGAGGCLRTVPGVAIHRAGEPDPAEIAGRRQDNGGTELVTLLATAGRDRAEWCAIWMAPPGSPADEAFEFRVAGITGRAIRSPRFTLAGGFDASSLLSLHCSVTDAMADAQQASTMPQDALVQQALLHQSQEIARLAADFDGVEEPADGGVLRVERALCAPYRTTAITPAPCSGWLDMLGLCDIGVTYCQDPLAP